MCRSKALRRVCMRLTGLYMERELGGEEVGLYLGIADGMSIARVWTCRYSK